MTKVTIYGASDDLVEVEGSIEGADEFSYFGGDGWQGVLSAPDGDTMRIYVNYTEHGVWTVAPAIYDEGYKFPSWPLSLAAGERATGTNDYTMVLTLEVPEGTILTAEEGAE